MGPFLHKGIAIGSTAAIILGMWVANLKQATPKNLQVYNLKL